MEWFLALPPKLQATLQMLAYCAQKNPTLEVVLDGMAENFGRAEAEQHDRELRVAEDPPPATYPSRKDTDSTPAESSRSVSPKSRSKRSA